MRTTIRIDDELLAEAKGQAAQSGRSLGALVEDALRAALARRATDEQRNRVDLPTFAGGSPRRGVDLDDSAA